MDDSVHLYSLFSQVLELEEAKGEWGFKALKQIMKLHFRLVRAHPHCTTPHLHHAVPPKPTMENWFVALPGQLRGHGCLLPAAPDVHQRSRDQELLGEVHQLHTGLHLHVQQRERTPTPHCFPHTATPLPHPQFKLLEELYSTTLETLRETRNERLWFKTNTKVRGYPGDG